MQDISIIAVAKKIDNFRYNPAKDSFKGWLLYLTRKRIAGEYIGSASAAGLRPI